MFGRQRKKQERQRHQYEVANKYTSSNVAWKSTVTTMTWQTTVNCSMRRLAYHISYHIIVDLKRQNRLKVGTNKPKLKVKMQSVSDDGVRKRQNRHVLSRRRKVYSAWEDMLHLLAGHSTHSRSSAQQLGKHGYRRLIAWQMAPEDDWCP